MTAPTYATSYSAANTLAECGEQYRLSKVERVPQLQAVYLMGGTSFHEASEWIDEHWDERSGIEDFTLTAQQVFLHGLLSQTYEAEAIEPDRSKWLVAGIRPRQDLSWWGQNGPDMVANYIAWREARPNLVIAQWGEFGQPAIEVPFDNLIIAGQPRRGAIDRVFVDQDTGTEIEIDLKTGQEPDKHLQHAIYREAWYQLTGRVLHWGAYYLAKKGQLSDLIDLTPHTTERLEGVLAMTDRAIQTGSFVPKPTTGFPCTNCLVRPFCRYV